MTQEEKELLIKDLCARLPYGVKIDIPDLFISTKNNIEVLNEIFCGDNSEFYCNNFGILIEYVKPYLFPLSSMTEEQKKEWLYTLSSDDNITYDTVDWCNENHLDYRGLIEKGLAIDATNLNIY